MAFNVMFWLTNAVKYINVQVYIVHYIWLWLLWCFYATLKHREQESGFICVIKFSVHSDFQTPINSRTLTWPWQSSTFSLGVATVSLSPCLTLAENRGCFSTLGVARVWTLTFLCLFSAAASCPIILSCILLQWAITSLSTASGLGPTARPCGCTGEQLSMFSRSSDSLSRCRARNGSLRSYWP